MKARIGDTVFYLTPFSRDIYMGKVMNIDANGHLRVTGGYVDGGVVLGSGTPVYMSREKAEKEAFRLKLKGE